MQNGEREETQPLAAAYEQRTKQLYEARGALAEVVSTLRLDLEQRLAETTALRQENSEIRRYAENLDSDYQKLARDHHKLAGDHHKLAGDHHKLHEHAQTLSSEVERLRRRVEALEAELTSAHDLIEVLQNMKVVRWTVLPRRIAYRMRERYR